MAQACRDAYSPPVVMMLWIVTEIAIMATDLAEVLGSAIALKLLFGWPMIAGVMVTAADVLLVLMVQVSDKLLFHVHVDQCYEHIVYNRGGV